MPYTLVRPSLQNDKEVQNGSIQEMIITCDRKNIMIRNSFIEFKVNINNSSVDLSNITPYDFISTYRLVINGKVIDEQTKPFIHINIFGDALMSKPFWNHSRATIPLDNFEYFHDTRSLPPANISLVLVFNHKHLESGAITISDLSSHVSVWDDLDSSTSFNFSSYKPFRFPENIGKRSYWINTAINASDWVIYSQNNKLKKYTINGKEYTKNEHIPIDNVLMSLEVYPEDMDKEFDMYFVYIFDNKIELEVKPNEYKLLKTTKVTLVDGNSVEAQSEH